MTHEEHCERHRQLHRALDELMADFLTFNRDKLPSNTTLLELMQWSYRQMENPDEWNSQEIPALYEVAKKICHERGLPWTDPRTGITYQPPKKKQKKAKRRIRTQKK